MALLCRVSGLAGSLCQVWLRAGATLHDLQVAVEASTGIQAKSQRIFCGLQEVTSSSSFQSFTVPDGAIEVLLVRRSPEQADCLERISQMPVAEVEDWFGIAAPPAAREDPEVVLAAVARSGFALRVAAPELRASRKVVLAAVAQSGGALRFASPELQADREIVLTAVRQNGFALCFAASELRADRAFVLAAIAQNGKVLYGASPELQADREVVLAAVAQDARALGAAVPELRADREIVITAVAQDGRTLRDAAPELRADRDVVLAAVAQDAAALLLAAPELWTDREVQALANTGCQVSGASGSTFNGFAALHRQAAQETAFMEMMMA